jgi:hypothetical protein
MAPKVVKVVPIDRSFKGLRDALFDEFDQLRNGKTKPERANACARLAGEITKSVAIQCELLRLTTRNGEVRELDGVRGLLQ